MEPQIRMRVAFFIPVIAGRGGIESVLSNLLQELHATGDDPRLFIFSGSREKAWLEPIPWVREIGNSAQPRPVRLCTYVWQAWKYLLRWKPDVIVCTHPSTLHLARFVRRTLNLKHVPVILWLHGPLPVHAGVDKALPVADGHICLCQERANEVRDTLARLAPASKAPIHVVYNGTPVGARYSMCPAAIPTFLYMGRLQAGPEKRVSDILAAVALLKGEYRLKIVGDGPPDEVRQLHDLADQARIAEKVQWLGWQTEPWSVVPSATALLLASSYEGFSMVTVEALALGVPVICSEFGGIVDEVVVPSKVGWTFPIGDVKRLASIMQAIIDHTVDMPSPEFIKSVGARFSTENMAVSFHSAIEAIRSGMTARRTA